MHASTPVRAEGRTLFTLWLLVRTWSAYLRRMLAQRVSQLTAAPLQRCIETALAPPYAFALAAICVLSLSTCCLSASAYVPFE